MTPPDPTPARRITPEQEAQANRIAVSIQNMKRLPIDSLYKAALQTSGAIARDKKHPMALVHRRALEILK